MTPELTAAAFYAAILLLKLATFPCIVGFNRIKRKVFVADEDVTSMGGQVKYTDLVIERIRR